MRYTKLSLPVALIVLCSLYTNAQNVGIGTSAPLTKLTVQTATGNYGITHTDGIVTLGTYIGNSEGWLGTKSNHPLTFFTNNSNEQMTLLTNGNFGIGTTVPATKLTIQTPNNTDGFSHVSDGGIILKEVVGGVSAGIGTYSNHAFRLVANSVPVINIDGLGNVGVGITDQTYKMDISDRIRIRSGSGTSAGLWLNNPNNSASIAFMGTKDVNITGIYGNTAGWSFVMNTDNGYVGMGAAGVNPANKLQIGSLGATGFGGNDLAIGNGTNAMSIYQTNVSTYISATTDIVLSPRNNANGNVVINGRIGIGTTAPSFPLEVKDNAIYSDIYYSYLNGVSALAGNDIGYCEACNPQVSIYAFYGVMAAEFDAFSDARIKDIKDISNTAKDLQTLNAIQVTNYTMKDKVKNGNKTFKKIIAQQVEEVYPQIVNKHTDFVPNVYQASAKVEKIASGYLITFSSKHNISPGAKKLRILLSETEGMKEVDIVSIPSDIQVIINVADIKADKVFVYGEEVNDFRTVDYDGLTTLNISATQELSKLVKQQQEEIDTQYAKIAELEEAIKKLNGK